jgi:hypothetical protein
MFYTDFTKVDIRDIEQLVANAVPESRTLEYKKNISIGGDKEKKEFLADISSFANADGGDIIYGLSEVEGIANELAGITENDMDSFLQKIDNLLRDGIQPRILYKIKTINTLDNKFIILINIDKSWNRPHRVILGGHDKFYSRNSNGKYALDTFELRDMFNFSNTLISKISMFKNERLLSILDGDLPVPIFQKGNVILHFIPFDSIVSLNIPVGKIKEKASNLGLLFWDHGHNSQYNLNGFLLYSSHGDAFSYDYTQLFRNGTIEAVDGLMFDDKIIPILAFEAHILAYFKSALKYLESLNVQFPVHFSISLINVRGYELPENNTVYSHVWGKKYITNDIIKIPESIIYNFDIKPESVLQPMFDIIWNACGCEKSINFDEEGNFLYKR